MATFNITVNLDWLDEEENLDEKIREEILSGIVAKVGDNITNSLESEARKLLDEKMLSLKGEISDKLNAMMNDFFNTPRDITNKWGEVKESGVTVTQLLSSACDDFLTQPVDENGRPASGYSAKYDTRIDYIVHKSINHDMEWAIKSAVDSITKNLKERISNEVKSQMGEKLAGIIGLDDMICNKKP